MTKHNCNFVTLFRKSLVVLKGAINTFERRCWLYHFCHLHGGTNKVFRTRTDLKVFRTDPIQIEYFKGFLRLIKYSVEHSDPPGRAHKNIKTAHKKT